MDKGNYLTTILRSEKTVFSFKDIALLWGDSGASAKSRINYYTKRGDLYHIRKGFYAKDKNYDRNELATKIYTPAYVSFETISGTNGLTFQYYSQIFVATYLSREIECDGQTYVFKKIKDTILTNKLGLENRGEYMVASPERALLDMLYVYKRYYFDNLTGIDWDKVFEILPIYGNQAMGKRVKKLYQDFQTENK